MTDGRLFLAITALICLGAFLNGLRFARMPDEKISRWMLIEMPGWLARGRTRAEQARLIGRIQMIVAPIFLLFVAAMCFGMLGPVQGMETIRL